MLLSRTTCEAREFRLARQLGASGIVRGGLTRVGLLVRLDAALYPIDETVAIARASVTAAPNELSALTDSLTWALLRHVWRTRTPPAPNLVAVTTHSVAALRAVLEGERLITQGRYGAAAAAFRRAFQEDSTFWFAYWSYAYAQYHMVEQAAVDSHVVATYTAHRFEFPERDRLLIEARMTDRLSLRITRSRTVAQRFPGYWPAQWEYANTLVHNGPLVGVRHSEIVAALERVLTLNPRLSQGWTHLSWLACRDLDTLSCGRSLRELTRLRYRPGSGQGPDQLQFMRYVYHLGRSHGAIDTTLADSMARDMAARHTALNPDAVGSGISSYGFHTAQLDLAARVLRHPLQAEFTAAFRRGLALSWTGRGAWDSALVVIERHASGTPEAGAALHAYRFAVIGRWLQAIEPNAVRRLRGVVDHAAAVLTPASRAELAWVDGVAAFAANDRAALAAARRDLGIADTASAPQLDRPLAALDLALAGRQRSAANAMLSLERDRAELWRDRREADQHPYLTIVNRLLAGRWLLAEGNAVEAARLLAFHEAVLWPAPQTLQASDMLAGLIYLERARAEEALGRRELARAYYDRFLRRYDLPVAGHRQYVDEARMALVRLGRQ